MEPWSQGIFSHLSRQELDEHRQKGAENAANWLDWRRQQLAAHSRERRRHTAGSQDEQLVPSDSSSPQASTVSAQRESTIKMETGDLQTDQDSTIEESASELRSQAGEGRDSADQSVSMGAEKPLDEEILVASAHRSPSLHEEEENIVIPSSSTPAASPSSLTDEPPRKKRKLLEESSSLPKSGSSRRIGRPPGSRAPLYFPTLTTSFYRIPTELEYDEMPVREKIRLSHIARIEEDIESEVADHPCRRCRGVGRPVCRRYTQRGVDLYESINSGNKCGYCRYRRQPCLWKASSPNPTSNDRREELSPDDTAFEPSLPDHGSLTSDKDDLAAEVVNAIMEQPDPSDSYSPSPAENDGASSVLSSPSSTPTPPPAPTMPQQQKKRSLRQPIYGHGGARHGSGRPTGSTVVTIRQPTIVGSYYDKASTMTAQEWNNLSANKRQKWSHVGMIEEVAGVVRSKPCRRCRGGKYACMVYDETLRSQYEGKKANLNPCAHCRWFRKSCQ